METNKGRLAKGKQRQSEIPGAGGGGQMSNRMKIERKLGKKQNRFLKSSRNGVEGG